jgi:heat shock 70kDa protein 1/2/6/8
MRLLLMEQLFKLLSCLFEKSTGMEQKITIKNHKGRMSADEIERLVQEAEIQSSRWSEAKNDEKLAEKISDEDNSKVDAAINETTSLLDNNQQAEKEEFEAKQKALESVVLPILQNLSGGAEGGALEVEALSDHPCLHRRQRRKKLREKL